MLVCCLFGFWFGWFLIGCWLWILLVGVLDVLHALGLGCLVMFGLPFVSDLFVWVWLIDCLGVALFGLMLYCFLFVCTLIWCCLLNWCVLRLFGGWLGWFLFGFYLDVGFLVEMNLLWWVDYGLFACVLDGFRRCFGDLVYFMLWLFDLFDECWSLVTLWLFVAACFVFV